MADTLYYVIPCYNEEEVLPETSKRLKVKMTKLMEEGKISRKSRVCFVNDGSRDQTWSTSGESTKSKLLDQQGTPQTSYFAECPSV